MSELARRLAKMFAGCPITFTGADRHPIGALLETGNPARPNGAFNAFPTTTEAITNGDDGPSGENLHDAISRFLTESANNGPNSMLAHTSPTTIEDNDPTNRGRPHTRRRARTTGDRPMVVIQASNGGNPAHPFGEEMIIDNHSTGHSGDRNGDTTVANFGHLTRHGEDIANHGDTRHPGVSNCDKETGVSFRRDARAPHPAVIGTVHVEQVLQLA
jgi:hypothetical protein